MYPTGYSLVLGLQRSYNSPGCALCMKLRKVDTIEKSCGGSPHVPRGIGCICLGLGGRSTKEQPVRTVRCRQNQAGL